ncbi:MAG: 5-formyltetrahydrofolate cyclo-ligase [Pseudonocardiales bacterium]|nr:5-formyltetrahydrofolate cyclo-ligase [Pseudonocardiales bacterium]MBV9142176.1 5-formyltetrahydrofolate cyclo-ligase [Pseudonocardiales bacterium]
MTDPIGPTRGNQRHGEVDENAKWALRQRLVAARRAVPAAVRKAETAALAEAALATTALAEAPLAGPPGTVCAYWPVGSEPGAPELLDTLARRGWRVLLPVVGAAAVPLDWAEYAGAGSLRAAPLGLLEPAGPRLGAAAIATAALVLVPALAVDRRGTRLGRGGGHYDRTLPLASPGTPLVAIVRDDEVLTCLPAQPHDVPVTAVLTPRRGLLPLPY